MISCPPTYTAGTRAAPAPCVRASSLSRSSADRVLLHVANDDPQRRLLLLQPGEKLLGLGTVRAAIAHEGLDRRRVRTSRPVHAVDQSDTQQDSQQNLQGARQKPSQTRLTLPSPRSGRAPGARHRHHKDRAESRKQRGPQPALPHFGVRTGFIRIKSARDSRGNRLHSTPRPAALPCALCGHPDAMLRLLVLVLMLVLQAAAPALGQSPEPTPQGTDPHSRCGETRADLRHRAGHPGLSR